MAQKGVQLDCESLSCSICLDLLNDPVTVNCGHSFCMSCIQTYWDTEDEKKIYSCPQCRQTFIPRPVLKKNTILASLVEDLKKSRLQAAPDDPSDAGPEDVACDFCSGRKLKAVKSCLQCLVSYCQIHLQPHFESPSFKKHKLVEPSKELQENICSRHDEVMKMFCRTDQQSICYLCSVDQHKGHDTVSAAAERTERQKDLEESRENIQQRVQDREEDVKLLQQKVEAINGSADKAVEHSQEIFSQLIRVMEKRRSEVEQQVRSQQEREVSRVKEIQDELEQEITELKRKDTDLQKLSLTEDHNQFLHSYSSLSGPVKPADSSRINIRSLRYFAEVTAAVSAVRDKLQDLLTETWTNVSQAVTEVDVLLSEPSEPKTRAGFLRYSERITLDPNTAHRQLLSKGKRRGTVSKQRQSYPDHQDRFTDHYYLKVLSRESPSEISELSSSGSESPEPEPKTRAGFLRYPKRTTLDPITANRELLSKGNRGATVSKQSQSYLDHPDRFTDDDQPEVLSGDSLPGLSDLTSPGSESPEPEPKTKSGFLRYPKRTTLDPITANRELLSKGNRRAIVSKQQKSYPDHPYRFTDGDQPKVLSGESLPGLYDLTSPGSESPEPEPKTKSGFLRYSKRSRHSKQ